MGFANPKRAMVRPHHFRQFAGIFHLDGLLIFPHFCQVIC
ncbi:Uncharacterized protein dnm_043150 [Desulfonema magnum]|uniref:Uncharacterized protein n=1 Tax=Desulfonema magnum TaxID=45655 RepID=A0A975GPU7_9BACT|nr:Uncharacterized protein dnm_043150 [Desulfonema magnum]